MPRPAGWRLEAGLYSLASNKQGDGAPGRAARMLFGRQNEHTILEALRTERPANRNLSGHKAPSRS
jgi:hypothetical protein